MGGLLCNYKIFTKKQVPGREDWVHKRMEKNDQYQVVIYELYPPKNIAKTRSL